MRLCPFRRPVCAGVPRGSPGKLAGQSDSSRDTKPGGPDLSTGDLPGENTVNFSQAGVKSDSENGPVIRI